MSRGVIQQWCSTIQELTRAQPIISIFYIIYMSILNNINPNPKFTISRLTHFVATIKKRPPELSLTNLCKTKNYQNGSLDIKPSIFYKDRSIQQPKCKCEFHQKVLNGDTVLFYKHKVDCQWSNTQQYKLKVANQARSHKKIRKVQIENLREQELSLAKQRIKQNRSQRLLRRNLSNLYTKNGPRLKTETDQKRQRIKLDCHNWKFTKFVEGQTILEESKEKEIQVKKNQYTYEYPFDPNYKYNNVLEYLRKLGYDFNTGSNVKIILETLEKCDQKTITKIDKYHTYGQELSNKYALPESQSSKIVLAWIKAGSKNSLTSTHKSVKSTCSSYFQDKRTQYSQKSNVENNDHKLSQFSRGNNKRFSSLSVKQIFQCQDQILNQYANAETNYLMMGLVQLQNELKDDYQRSKDTKIVPEYVIELKTSTFVEKVIKSIENSQTLNEFQIIERTQMLHDGLKIIQHYEDEMINLDLTTQEERRVNKRNSSKIMMNFESFKSLNSDGQQTGKNSSQQNNIGHQKINNLVFKKDKKRQELKTEQSSLPNAPVADIIIEQDDEQEWDIQESRLKMGLPRKKKQGKIQQYEDMLEYEQGGQFQQEGQRTRTQSSKYGNKKIYQNYKSPLVKLYHFKLNKILEDLNDHLIDKHLAQFQIKKQDDNFVRRRKIKKLKKYLQSFPEYNDHQLMRNIKMYEEHDILTKIANTEDRTSQLTNIQSRNEDKLLLKNIIGALEYSPNQEEEFKMACGLEAMLNVSNTEQSFDQGHTQSDEEEVKKKNEIQKLQNLINTQNVVHARKSKDNQIDNKIRRNKATDDVLIQKDLDCRQILRQCFIPNINLNKTTNMVNTRQTIKQKSEKQKLKQVLKKLKNSKPDTFNHLLRFQCD